MFTKTLKLLVLVGALFFSYKTIAQPTFTVQNVKGACEGFPNGSFDVLVNTASGAVNIFYFSGPLFGGPFPATVGTAITIPGLAGSPFPGRVYQLVVQDAVDFSTANVNIISYPTPITITIDNVTDNSDCVTSNGSISISPTGGSGSYTFAWTEASLGFTANTEDIANLLGGNYSLTITDNNTNCVESFPPIAVDNPSPVLFQLDVTPNPLPVCSGTNLVLSLDGSEVGATYEVIRNNVTATGITQTGTGAPLNFTVPAGTFANGDNFKIRATNGICQGDMTGALIVSILPLPTASINGSATICSGTSTNLTFTLPAGSYNVVYTDGTTNFNANGIANNATVSVSPTVSATYTIVSVTNVATLCTSTAPSPNITGSAAVTVNPSPTAAVLSVSGTSTICAGSSANLIVTITGGTSPYSITLNNGIGTINNYVSGTPIPVSPATTTSYNMVGNVTDASGCTVAGSGTATVTVNLPPTSAVLSVVGPSTICSGVGANLTVTITGGTSPYTININNGVGTISNYVSGTPIPINPAVTTTYAMVGNVTDAAGCTVAGSGSALVTVNPSPTAAVLSVSGTSTICAGSSANLIVTITGGTSPYTITLDNGIGTINNYVSGTAIPVSPGTTTTYNMVGNVTDALGCTVAGSGTATVTVNIPPTSAVLSLSGAGTVCSGTGTTLIVTITGGTSPYTININNGVGTIANYVSGTPIPVNPAATTTYAMVGNVTDAAGCSVAGTGSALVTVNPSPTAAVLSVSGTSTICGGSGANLIVTITGGTSPYTITLNNGIGVINNYVSGTPIPVNPAATTTYNMVGNVTDALGCTVAGSGTATITVNIPPTSAVLSLSGAGTVCSGTGSTLIVTITGGSSPYTININNGVGTIANYVSGTPIPVTPAATTTYAMVGNVTDAAGCTVAGSGSALVTVNPSPTAAVLSVSGTSTLCAGSSANLIVTITGGTSPYTITLNNGIGVINNYVSGTAIPASPGTTTTYNMVGNVTDALGCTVAGSGTATITVNPPPTSAILSVVGSGAICTGSGANLTVTITGGTSPYSITINNGIGTINNYVSGTSIPVNPAVTTTYAMVGNVTDAAGCTVAGSGSALVTVSPIPTITLGANPSVCAGSTAANLPYTGTTGAPDQYSIDFNGAAQTQGFADIVNAALSATPIAITVPGTAVAGTYSGSLFVRNSISGCLSGPTPITITILAGPTATISGTTSICAGSQASITINFTGTGPWNFVYNDGTSDIPAASSFPSISFNVLPTVTTTYSLVSVTDASVTACPGAVSGSAVVTVNQAPQTNLTVGATINPLCGGGITGITVDNSENGVSYQLRNDVGDVPMGTPLMGNGGTITLTTTPLSANTTFNVLATATGCTPVELANTVTVTVTGAINAGLTVTAQNPTICSGGTTTIQVANSENGVLYQLRNDAGDINIGGPLPGTGGTINLPAPNPLLATTTFNVLASNGTCSIELTDTETVTVSPSPDPSLAVDVTLSPLCVGGSTTITVTGSQSGISYQLINLAGNVPVGSPIVSSGGTIALPTLVLNTTTTFFVRATGTGCPPVDLTDQVTVVVSGAIDASLAVTAAASTICEGPGTNIQIVGSENGVTYQLRNNLDDSPINSAPGNGGTINIPTGPLSATTTFNVLATNGTCSIELTDLETVNVDPAPDAALIVGKTLDPLCVGGISAVTVAGSEAGVTYQLRNEADDSNVGPAVLSTGGSINLPTGVLNATTSFYVVATSGVCPDVELTMHVTINVAGSLNSGLTVASSASTICEGGSTFIQVQASENGVNYQLRNDLNDNPINPPVTGDGGTINLPTGNISVNTTFNVVASNGTCSIELTDTETVTVNPAPAINLAVAASSTLICSGASTNIVITGSESGVSYQLRNNVGNVLVGSAVVSTGGNLLLPVVNLTTTTTFNVLATLGSCSAQLTATPTVTIRPLGDPACGGGGSDCTNFSSIVPTIVTQPSCNDLDDGEVSFTIARADATPTTFRVLWTIGSTTQTKFTSNTVSFNDLSSGAYQYTIIDEGNGKACGPVDFFLDLQTKVHILDKQVTGNVTCYGGTDGNAILTVDGSSTGEYWYKYVLNGVESSAQTFTPGAPLPGGLPADDNGFVIIKVDETFNFLCPDTVNVRIRHTFPKIDFGVSSTEVTTCNGTDGSILVSAISGGDSGTNPLQVRLKKAVPFTTDPSGYVVLIDFEDVANGVKEYMDLTQGNYVVDVKDDLDCIQSKPIAVQAPGQVPLSSVTVTPSDATCINEGASGSITVVISDAGLFQVAVSQDQINVPADDEFVDYGSPGLPSITFNNLVRGAYYLYIKSSTTTCPTRTDAINIGGVQAIDSFEVLSNCVNQNLTINNITGQTDAPFVIRVYDMDDKFVKIDSLTSSSIPLSRSVTFVYNPPLEHSFLSIPGTYRFVMVQTQTFGTSTCTLVSDDVVYDVRLGLSITLGKVEKSYPTPKRTGSIEIADIDGGTRFLSPANELYYEIALYDADDDVVIEDWTEVKLDPQNKFTKLYEYLPPGVYRIKVRDAAGCEKSIDTEIGLDQRVYVPNIFTPNDDGVNDEFEIINLPLTSQHKLIISNRWGEEVFKSGDYREGTFWNANDAADGIYFYRLQVAGGETFTGWVEVLRGSKP